MQKALSVAGRRHDLIAVHLGDRRESVLPPLGYMEFEDAETGELLTVNTADVRFRAEFESRAARERAELGRTLRHSRVDVIDIETDQPYVQPLMLFFKKRGGRFR